MTPDRALGERLRKFVLIGTLFFGFFALARGLQGAWMVMASNLVLVALFPILLQVAERGSYRTQVAISHTLLMLGCLEILATSLYTGQSHAMAPWYLALAPVVAGFLLRTEAMLVWVAIPLLMLIGIHTSEQLAVLTPEIRLVPSDHLVGQVCLVLALAAFSWAHLRLHARQLQAAMQALEVKSQFLANMSHEIRTPLHGVLGMAQTLDTARLSPEDREAVDAILRSGELLLSVVNDILDFTKVESGSLALETVPSSVSEAIEDVLRLFGPLAREKGLQLGAEIDPSLPPRVLTDPTRLRQILGNLVSNAIKFTHRGAVTVRADRWEGKLRIQVRDTGIGIASASLPRLFEPFHQEDASTTRHYGGTGLGLAISRRLARLMEGDLEVASRPGEGSTFSLWLPLEPAPDGLEEPAASAGKPGPLVAGRILVAEDNPTNRRVMERMLERLGYIADVVEDGGQALEAIAARDYALLLLDLHMPRVDGAEVLRRVRAGECGRQPRVVMISASVLEEDRVALTRAGADGFLAKPARLQALREVLSELVPPPN